MMKDNPTADKTYTSDYNFNEYLNTFKFCISSYAANDMNIREAYNNPEENKLKTEINRLMDSLLSEIQFDRYLEEDVFGIYSIDEMMPIIKAINSDPMLKSDVQYDIARSVFESLNQLEKTRLLAKELNLPFSDRFSEGADEEFNPYLFDGSMSVEDFRQMQDLYEEAEAAEV